MSYRFAILQSAVPKWAVVRQDSQSIISGSNSAGALWFLTRSIPRGWIIAPKQHHVIKQLIRSVIFCNNKYRIMWKTGME